MLHASWRRAQGCLLQGFRVGVWLSSTARDLGVAKVADPFLGAPEIRVTIFGSSQNEDKMVLGLSWGCMLIENSMSTVSHTRLTLCRA